MSLFSKIMKDEKFNLNILDRDEKPEYISSGVLTVNLMASGKITGGFPKGKISQIAAPSTLGKSFIGLSTLKNAQKMGMDCIIIDSEKAFDFNWATNIGIDTDPKKLLVYQSTEVNDIRNFLGKLLKDADRSTRKNIFILLDSWGPLITDRLISNAEKGNDAKDMSKPVAKNELADYLNFTRTTVLIVNHVYDNVGGFGDLMNIPGGRRIEFLSDLIILAYSQAKDKENDEISGKLVSAKVKKGRGVVEHKVAKYRIKHDGGLDPFYGLLPFAEEGGYVIKPKNGRYAPAHIPDHPGVKLVDVYTKEFWLPILKETDFKDYLKNIFTFANRPIDIAKNDITEEINDEHINENQDSE
jgi:RecA/RadA recombinase